MKYPRQPAEEAKMRNNNAGPGTKGGREGGCRGGGGGVGVEMGVKLVLEVGSSWTLLYGMLQVPTLAQPFSPALQTPLSSPNNISQLGWESVARTGQRVSAVTSYGPGIACTTTV